MKERWVPDFLGMLQKMQYLGYIGCSREITFFSDGDGDFRPKFTWSEELPKPATAKNDDPPTKVPKDSGYFFDAG